MFVRADDGHLDRKTPAGATIPQSSKPLKRSGTFRSGQREWEDKAGSLAKAESVKSAGRGRLPPFLVSSQKDLALLLERHLQI